jgi:hypothetical protein
LARSHLIEHPIGHSVLKGRGQFQPPASSTQQGAVGIRDRRHARGHQAGRDAELVLRVKDEEVGRALSRTE